jgi:predicted small metal-binding protein
MTPTGSHAADAHGTDSVADEVVEAITAGITDA